MEEIRKIEEEYVKLHRLQLFLGSIFRNHAICTSDLLSSNQLGNDLVQINLVSVRERGTLLRTVATETPRQRTYMSTGLMETEKDRRVEDADSVAIRKVRHRQGRAEWKQPAAFLRSDRYEAFTCRVAPWADDDIRTVQFSPLIIYPLDYRSPLSTTASRRSYRSQPVSSPTLTDPTTHIS